MVAWRNILFFTFIVFIAPFEYHADWFVEWQKHQHKFMESLTAPMIQGALFFYSIIILVEAIVRMEMHPAMAKHPKTRALKFFAWIGFFPFLGFLLIGVDSRLTDGWIRLQWLTALFSMLVSFFTYWFIENRGGQHS